LELALLLQVVLDFLSLVSPDVDWIAAFAVADLAPVDR
jgi:hypothetical protein